MVTAPPPSESERYCAWFGDERDATLFIGLSPFWWALQRHGGDARGDLERPGPQFLGRFDLAREAFLPSIGVGAPSARAGLWDVLAHPNGRVYFTSYFEPAGSVDPASGDVTHFPDAGIGLNELALGPGARVLVTRYGYEPDERGALVVLDEEGTVLQEHVLEGPPGFRPAAKSVAFDPLRRETWLNTDLLPLAPEEKVANDVRVLGEDGALLHHFAEPEVQFMIFDAAGTGWFVEREEDRLYMRIRTAADARKSALAGARVLLDPHFPALDFAQDVRGADDGSVLVTRWSGQLHRVWPDGRVRDMRLPAIEGFYYTAVVHGDRVCATHCGDVTVVCADWP